MVKTPEEYFSAQNFDLPIPEKASGMTPAEQAFLQKYVGVDGIRALGLSETARTVPAEAPRNLPLHEELKNAASIQMIFFYLESQLYAIPIDAVQEVIKYVPPINLPLMPPYVAGVMNLRGRVTPLLHLDQLLCSAHGRDMEDGFIIICTRNGLQIGLIVERIHNMYTMKQERIIWNVESQIGANADFLCGIIDFNDSVFGIVSIDMIVDHVIRN